MSVHGFELFPNHTLTVIVYNNVTKSNEIIKQLQERDLSVAVLKTKCVASLFTLLSAANRALHNAVNDQLKTRALESELLYNLSSSHSISYAFKTFGVGEDSSSVVACIFNATEESTRALDEIIMGDRVEETVIDEMGAEKVELLTKLYKIKPEDLVHRSLSNAINNILSIRNVKSRK